MAPFRSGNPFAPAGPKAAAGPVRSKGSVGLAAPFAPGRTQAPVAQMLC